MRMQVILDSACGFRPYMGREERRAQGLDWSWSGTDDIWSALGQLKQLLDEIDDPEESMICRETLLYVATRNCFYKLGVRRTSEAQVVIVLFELFFFRTFVLSFFLSFFLSFSISMICLSVCLSVCLSACLSICQSVVLYRSSENFASIRLAAPALSFSSFFWTWQLLTKENCCRNRSKANVSEVLRKYLLFAPWQALGNFFDLIARAALSFFFFPKGHALSLIVRIWLSCWQTDSKNYVNLICIGNWYPGHKIQRTVRKNLHVFYPHHSTRGRESDEVGDPPSHPASKSGLI